MKKSRRADQDVCAEETGWDNRWIKGACSRYWFLFYETTVIHKTGKRGSSRANSDRPNLKPYSCLLPLSKRQGFPVRFHRPRHQTGFYPPHIEIPNHPNLLHFLYSERLNIVSRTCSSPLLKSSPRGCRGEVECLKPGYPGGRRDGNFRLPLVTMGLAHHFQDMAPKDKVLGQIFSPLTNIAGATGSALIRPL